MNDDADVSMESLGGKGDSRDGGIVWTSTQTGTETINDILKYSSSKFCFGCSADENTCERVESCWCEQSALDPSASPEIALSFPSKLCSLTSLSLSAHL